MSDDVAALKESAQAHAKYTELVIKFRSAGLLHRLWWALIGDIT
jgi:hypothetical protein